MASLCVGAPAQAILVGEGDAVFENCPEGWQNAGHQCRMSPPRPPQDEPWVDANGDGVADSGEFEDWNGDGVRTLGDYWGSAANGGNGGWMAHLKWCLGQTKTVTNPLFARQVTTIYGAGSDKDSWTLRDEVDCAGKTGIFAGNPGLYDQFRAEAGMPPVGAALPREQENCLAFHGPIDLPADTDPERDPIVGFKVYMQPGSHHLIVWDIINACNDANGEACHGALFPPGGVNQWQSFVCNGVVDFFNRVLMSGSQHVEYGAPFPDDAADAGHGSPGHVHEPLVGFDYGKRHYFLFNHHIQRYPNWDPTESIAGEAWINYYRAPKKPRHEAHVVLEGLTGDATIFIPPYTVGSPHGVWLPPKWPAWVFGLSAHMHKRGLHFFTNKTPANPPEGTGHSDPECTNTAGLPFLYETSSWSEPKNCFYVPTATNPDAHPIRFDVGEGLRYECVTNNGVQATNDLPPELRQAVAPYFSAREVKWACEEVPGVPPGIPFFFLAGRHPIQCAPDDPATFPLGAPAADSDCCQPGTGPGTSAPCAGKSGQLGPWPSTGRCVPANLVFGPSQDDEMCLLPLMFWYDEKGVPSGFPTYEGASF